MKKTKIDFDKQYRQKYSFKSMGGSMSLRKLSHGGGERRTVILVPGWCESFAMMRPVALSFAEKGYDVIVLDYQHLDNLKAFNGNLDTISDTIPKNEYAKALALVNFLKENKIDSVSVVAHSEGAIIGTLAVHIEDTLFSSLTLVNPAGFIKEKNFRILSARFFYSIYKQDIRNFSKHLWQQLRFKAEVFNVMLRNPIQSFKDGFAMSNHSITDVVSEICIKDDVQIDIIFNKDDALFPLRALQKASVNICDERLHIMSGGHNQMYIDIKNFTKTVNNLIR